MSSFELVLRFAAACLIACGAIVWWVRRRSFSPRQIAVHVYVDGVERKTSLVPRRDQQETKPAVLDRAPVLPGKRLMRFLMDALLLHESFRAVCPQERIGFQRPNSFRESLHYMTGVKVNADTYVVTRIVPVRFSYQSAGGVRVADESNIETLSGLDECGLPLLMHIHSHPGFGPQANRPSAIDRALQERLERGGHIAIGGIFSRSGHVRFFAGDLDRFVVEVEGNHVKKIADNEFALELGNDGFSRRFPVTE